MDTPLVCKEKHHENELLKSFCKQCRAKSAFVTNVGRHVTINIPRWISTKPPKIAKSLYRRVVT